MLEVLRLWVGRCWSAILGGVWGGIWEDLCWNEILKIATLCILAFNILCSDRTVCEKVNKTWTRFMGCWVKCIILFVWVMKPPDFHLPTEGLVLFNYGWWEIGFLRWIGKRTVMEWVKAGVIIIANLNESLENSVWKTRQKPNGFVVQMWLREAIRSIIDYCHA